MSAPENTQTFLICSRDLKKQFYIYNVSFKRVVEDNNLRNKTTSIRKYFTFITSYNFNYAVKTVFNELLQVVFEENKNTSLLLSYTKIA